MPQRHTKTNILAFPSFHCCCCCARAVRYGLISFSLFGTEELLRFAFNCFDPERNGTIDLSDFNMMSRLLHAR